MQKFMNWFVGEESGQSMVEYGLIIGLIAVVLITALKGVSGSLNTLFTNIQTALNGARP